MSWTARSTSTVHTATMSSRRYVEITNVLALPKYNADCVAD